MRVLVTGSKGQLGLEIISAIRNGYTELGNVPREFLEADIIECDVDNLDITDLEKVKEHFIELRPELVINSAAYTNVDDCEKNIDLAYKVNALGARNVAIACDLIGAKLMHISTDYIFKGVGNNPFREYDIPSPESIYGKTKLAGEEYVKAYCKKSFIVRTAWLYGEKGKNFVYTIINAAKKSGSLNVVNDQKGNPTNAQDLVHHILKLLTTEEYGIYHCTGKGECTWYDFACKIVELSQIDCIVNPCTSDEYKRPAKRPEFSSLDNMALRLTVGDDTREWDKALESFVNKVNNIK